jgi:hypothetical protein
MFNIKNRFCSDSKTEKAHGVIYILLLLSIPIVAYLAFTNYVHLNIYCFIGLGLYSLFLYTTLSGFLDYGDLKNSHNDSFEKYKAMINPSKGSLLFKWLKADIEKKENYGKNDELGESGSVIMLSLLVCVITGGVWLFNDSPYPFALAALNMFFVLFSLYFGGCTINDIEIDPKQIEQINNISDLSLQEKNKFKSYLKTKVDKNKKITKGDMDTVFKKIDAMKKERELNEALETHSQIDLRKKGDTL